MGRFDELFTGLIGEEDADVEESRGDDDTVALIVLLLSKVRPDV